MKKSEINGIKISCEFSDLAPITDIKEHPKNRNKHPSDQIDRLAKLIEYHGFRHPILVSRLSGYVVAGHGRLEAAKRIGMEVVPVDYQEFENEDAEYAFLISDNAIALWAELDFHGINSDIGDLGPDFNIDLLGIKNFTLDFEQSKFDPSSEDREPKTKQLKHCPHCGLEL